MSDHPSHAAPAAVSIDTVVVRGAGLTAGAGTAIAHGVASAVAHGLTSHGKPSIGGRIGEMTLRLPAKALAADGSIDPVALTRALAEWRGANGERGGSHG